MTLPYFIKDLGWSGIEFVHSAITWVQLCLIYSKRQPSDVFLFRTSLRCFVKLYKICFVYKLSVCCATLYSSTCSCLDINFVTLTPTITFDVNGDWDNLTLSSTVDPQHSPFKKLIIDFHPKFPKQAASAKTTYELIGFFIHQPFRTTSLLATSRQNLWNLFSLCDDSLKPLTLHSEQRLESFECDCELCYRVSVGLVSL